MMRDLHSWRLVRHENAGDCLKCPASLLCSVHLAAGSQCLRRGSLTRMCTIFMQICLVIIRKAPRMQVLHGNHYQAMQGIVVSSASRQHSRTMSVDFRDSAMGPVRLAWWVQESCTLQALLAPVASSAVGPAVLGSPWPRVWACLGRPPALA